MEEIIQSIALSYQMWSRYGNGIVDVLGSDRAAKDVVEEIEATTING